MPRVTVVIPTYNWSTVLPYSIGSVLRQTFADLELLVIGDGCTDDSEAVVRAVGDPRVRWINLPANTGHQSGPNNEGLRLARGEIIAYLGHDDLWLPHHLALLVPAVAGGAGLAYGITALVREAGARVDPMPLGLRAWRPGRWIPPSAMVHGRAAALEVGGWPHPRAVAVDPESDLWARMARGGGRVTFVPRLTAVKFPAAYTKDAYRLRPSAIQAAWFEQIGREPDFEAAALGRMLVAAEGRPARALVGRALWRLEARAWRALGYTRGVLDRNRRYKGLPPLP